jgi:hypothetical protein
MRTWKKESKMKKFMSVTVLIVSTILPAMVLGWNADGTWEARTMGAKIKADMQQQGDQITGVARVYPPAGKKVIYHFYGRVEGDRITASHPDGHAFRGKFVSPGRIAGSLTTKDGHSLSITASRR